MKALCVYELGSRFCGVDIENMKNHKGEAVEPHAILEGCNKTLECCRTKFNNSERFGGLPVLYNKELI